jgi:hypothetical protein
MKELDINKLFEDAKSYPHKLIRFEIDWEVMETPIIKESGGAFVERSIRPIIKIQYE